MVVVMREASEPRQAAVISLPLPLLLLPFLLPPPDLIIQLGLPVHFLCSLPVVRTRARVTKRRDAKMTSTPSPL